MNQPSVDEELIRRTRHDGPYYAADNKNAFLTLRELLHGGPGWTWISEFARTKDGKKAFLALIKHYKGPANTKKQLSDALHDLNTIFYNGRNKNFTFENFSGRLNKAFNNLKECGQEYNGQTMVHILLKAIQDPLLEHAKMKILGDQALLSNYSDSVAYLKIANNNYINSRKQESRKVSSVRDGNRGGRGN
jgi:hypothetical protein